MGDSMTVSTPVEPRSHLGIEGCPQTKGKKVAMEGIPYKSLVGSLMYLAICTRLDLAIGVSTLTHFFHFMVHWEATKRLLRYVKGSVGDGLLCIRVRMWSYGGIVMPALAAIQRLRGDALGL